jgi:hypothetical protein
MLSLQLAETHRGANGPVKNEQTKSRRTNNKKKNRKKGANSKEWTNYMP